MDNTSRMVALLGAVRKQMNGAVLDTLRYYGADYGLNYGVAIHSLRETARETRCGLPSRTARRLPISRSGQQA